MERITAETVPSQRKAKTAPFAYVLQTAHVEDVKAAGLPVSGSLLARAGSEVLRHHVWTQACDTCGDDFILLAVEGETPRGYRRCLRCKRANLQASWAASKRRQRAVTNPAPGQKPCSQCGQLFQPKRSTAKFCSTKCRVAAHRTKD